MNRENECPIWGTLATFAPTIGDSSEVQSARAGGAYTISGSAKCLVGESTESEKVKLTSWLVEQRRLGEPCPKISGDTLAEIANWRAPSVHERADKLLLFVASESQVIGKRFSFSIRLLNNELNSWEWSPEFEKILAHSASIEATEVNYLFDYLVQQEFTSRCVYLEGSQGSGPHSGRDSYSEYLVTPRGYARLAALDGINTSSWQGFVAMWFHPDMDDAYNNGLRLAIEGAGYQPLRIDFVDHNDKIDDEIIAEIRRSRFVVADFTHGETGVRGGVYYEAGFAHGLNIPVIFTCRKDRQKEIHFDTRQFNHIFWEDAKDLHKQLQQRISATIGDGPLKKPT